MGKENLRSFNNLSKEEHIALSRKGGINSGRKRRFRKMMAAVVDQWTQDTIRYIEKDWRKFENETQHYNETMDTLSSLTEREQMELFEALEAELNELLDTTGIPETDTRI